LRLIFSCDAALLGLTQCESPVAPAGWACQTVPMKCELACLVGGRDLVPEIFVGTLQAVF
jgi:hypothetical protein